MNREKLLSELRAHSERRRIEAASLITDIQSLQSELGAQKTMLESATLVLTDAMVEHERLLNVCGSLERRLNVIRQKRDRLNYAAEAAENLIKSIDE